jgi:hypothetical protein
MSDYSSTHEWFRDDVVITGYRDRADRLSSRDVEEKRKSVSPQPVAEASGKETPSKSPSSSTP